MSWATTTKRYGPASRVIELAQTVDPRYWNALLWLGWCRLAMGAHSEARSCFERVLGSTQAPAEERQDATNGLKELHWEIGESFYNSGEFSEAASEYESLLSLLTDDDEDRSSALLWVADCHMSLDAVEQARERYQAVLDSQGATEEQKQAATDGIRANHWRLGESFCKSGDYSKAASEYDALLSLLGEDDEHRCRVLLRLGHCRTVLGDQNGGRECYQAVLASPSATGQEKKLASQALGEDTGFPGLLKKWIQ